MAGADLLDEAVAELYSADPEEFMRRRQELSAQARAAGQIPVAKQIAALRKPTRTAWVINQLARSDPDAVTELADLGAELRSVERAGDGTRLRELSQTRRHLVATLVRQALDVCGQATAPAGMREEITATFAAALADAEVAEEIARGTLVRAQRRSGFGTAQAPTLTVVPQPKTSATTTRQEHPAPRTAGRNAAAGKVAGGNAAGGKAAGGKAAGKQAVQRERLARARAKAEQALAEADGAVAAATQEQRDLEQTIRRLERELAAARGGLRAAGAEVRRAEATQRRARAALDRLPGD